MKSGRVLQFPFARGLAEDDNEKDKPVATLKSAVNIRWPKAGVIGKRWGTRVLPPVSGKRFIPRDQELAISDGERIRSYDADSNTWVTGPRITDVSLTWKTHVDSVRGVSAADTAILDDGSIVEVWLDGEPEVIAECGLWYQVRNEAGTIVLPPTQISDEAYRHIRLLSSGNTWLVIYAESGEVYAFSPSGGSTLLEVGAETSLDSFALDAILDDEEFIIAFNLEAGGISLERFTFVAAPVAVSDDVVTGENSTTIHSIGLALGTNLFIVYDSEEDDSIMFACANPTTLAQTRIPTVVETATDLEKATVAPAMSSSTNCLILYSYSSTLSETGVMKTAQVVVGGTVSTGQATTFLRPLSKPFAVGSRFYALASTDSLSLGFENEPIVGSETFLIDATYSNDTEPFRLVGHLDVNIGGAWSRGFVTVATVESSTITHVVAPYTSVPSRYRTGWRQGIRSVRVASGDDLAPDMWRSVEIQREAIVSGALVTAYDSVEAVGYGWPHAPYLNPEGFGAANGGSMANGSYLYNITAERVSGVGVMHRSPFGVALSTTVNSGPTGEVSVQITGALVGRPRRNQGHYAVYRSPANGSNLHRLTIEPSFMVFRDGSSGAQPFATDESPDNAIGANGDIELDTRPLPYTDGNELEDFQPPASWSLHLHNNRLGIITGSRREYWWSKDVNENPGIAPGFHPTQFEIYDRDLVAAATLDDKRIMFAEDRIWVVFGTGPNVSGEDNRFSAPQRVQTDVGCTNPRSVVSWVGGVMFQSGTDLYNLTRELGVIWIGRDVRDVTAAYPNITSAVLVSDQSEIRFTCNSAESGIVLVFDYDRSTWSTRTYPGYDDESLGGGLILDATLHRSVYYLMLEDEVRYEDVTTHLDTVQDGSGSATQYAPSTVELNTIQPGGTIAWQRVRIAKPIGASLSNHALTISVSRDFASTYEQVETFAAGSAVTSLGTYERAEVALTVQRRQSVGIKVTDAAPANTTSHPLGNGAGFQLEGIALLVQPKPGLPRDAASRRGG